MKRMIRIAALFGMLCLLMMGSWALYRFEMLPDALKLHCVIYRMTGFYCPGCGASRACYAILHGDWRIAINKNILLVILLPLFGIYAVLRTGDWAFTGKNHIDRYIPKKCLYIVLGLVLFYGVIRNISVWPFYLLQPR